MSPNNIYRSNAQDCLRMAQAAPDERDLAEHAARGGDEVETHEFPVASDTH